MTTALLDGTVNDQNGVAVPGALVYIYDYIGNIASLADSLGQVLANPVTTDESGYWSAYVPSGNFYTMKYYWAGRLREIEANRAVGAEALAGGVILGARDAALAAQTAAATSEANAAVSETTAQTAATSAGAAQVAAQGYSIDAAAYRDAAIADFRHFPSTAAALGRGVVGYSSLVGGSGGANGVFSLATTGGTKVVAAVGTFTVSGGAVTALNFTDPGYYTVDPTGFDFSASTGLTGASATPQLAANTVDGNDFQIPSTNSGYVDLYKNNAGSASLIATLVSSAQVAQYVISTGDELPSGSVALALLAGATALGANGITIPTGNSGANSHILFVEQFAAAGRAGQPISRTMTLTQSATFTRTINNKFEVGLAAGGTADRTSSATFTTTTVGTLRTVTVDYALVGDESELHPWQQLSSVGNTATNETLTLTAVKGKFDAALNPLFSANDENVNYRILTGVGVQLAFGYGRVPALTRVASVTVAPTGGDYTSVIAAIAGLGARSIGTRAKIAVQKGTYATTEVACGDYIDLLGVGRDDSILDGSQTTSVSAAQLAANSTMTINRNVRVENLGSIIKNGRYAGHMDTFGVRPNVIIEFHGCGFEHLGNDEWDAANPLLTKWGNQSGIGGGMSSGQQVLARDSLFISKNASGFFYHTNGLNSEPILVDLEGCEFVSHSTAANTVAGMFGFAALGIQPIGSFQRDRCRLVGNVFGGKIAYIPSSWQPTTLDKQPANRAEIDVYGHSNSPSLFVNGDWSLALRFDSATTGAASSVAVSGDAVKWVLGNGTSDWYYTRPGSVGFSGAVRGWGDVQETVGVGPNADQFITALGKRLGDCSSVNKTLVVTVDGGSPITITFNQNYTAQNNATILAAINAALGGAAIASFYAPGARRRPRFTDEEKSLLNSSGSGILMGTVLAYDASGHKARPMTGADAATLFAGVAWEDIEANKRGRVKTRGYLPMTDVLRTDSATFAFGDTFSIDAAAPGKVYKGGTQGLLKAIAADAVQVAV